MINREMKTYTLQVLTTTKDDFGHTKESWENIAPIEVAINETFANVANDDGVLFNKKIVSGVTRSNIMTRDKKYRIVLGNVAYQVDDFIVNRYVLLRLSAVIGFINATSMDGYLVMDGSVSFDGDDKRGYYKH